VYYWEKSLADSSDFSHFLSINLYEYLLFPLPTGIPQVPTPPTGISNSPGSVVFTVSTRESGTTPPQMFSFIVNITLVFDRSRFSHTLEVNDYIDGEARQFTIDGLMTGDVYLFSVQAQNEFGASEFSGNSLLIRGTFQCVCTCMCVVCACVMCECVRLMCVHV